MLFNSYVFIFAFLPVTLAGFFVLGRIGPRYAAAPTTLVTRFVYSRSVFKSSLAIALTSYFR